MASEKYENIDELIDACQSRIAEIENGLWGNEGFPPTSAGNGSLDSLHEAGFNESLLESYQAAFRQLEQLIAAQGNNDRHHFVIVIPVADRPQHLKACLDSLLYLCRAFAYGGQRNGMHQKISVVIADDTRDPDNIARNQEIARHFTQQGIATRHFGLSEQLALIDSLSEAKKAHLSRVLGSAKRDAFSHKGQAITRNIAYLQLSQLLAPSHLKGEGDNHEKILFYTIDSDQEFKVKVSTAQGDRDVYAVNFFYHLDKIFTRTDALVLTGKVVGDPPVSPAVMAGNFLEDVIGFLQEMAKSGLQRPCQHHQTSSHREGEASYHDMADLFGFKPASEAYAYRCTLTGEHTDADCFAHFASRLNSFFYGEHPTRISYYLHAALFQTIRPARTVYAGNYIFRPEGLKYFIPFASMRLRMSGPTLGRLIKSEIKERFVSANLPMLHKRTVEGTGQSEFRPGINSEASIIELCDEFERQFYGDVMLFSVERLTARGFPLQDIPDEVIAETLQAVHAEMHQKYTAKHQAIVEKLGQLQSLLYDPANWWNQSGQHAAAVGNFQAFAGNIAHNFGADSPCYHLINSAPNWEKWQAKLLEAIIRYPEDSRAWREALATPHKIQPA